MAGSPDKPVEIKTGDTGTASFKNIPQGEYLLHVYKWYRRWVEGWNYSRTVYGWIPGYGRVSAVIPVTLSASDDGKVIDIAVPLCTVTIEGQVVAGDGETGIPDVDVYLNNSYGERMDWLQTDDEGTFSIELEVMSGKEELELETVASTGSRSTADFSDVRSIQTVTIDGDEISLPPVVVPISVVKGKVGGTYKGHYEPVSEIRWGELFTTNPTMVNELGIVRMDLPHYYKEGRYLFLGLPLDDFEIIAHNPNNGKTVTRKGRIESIEKAVEIDLLFPPTNDLRVLAKDAEGNPLKAGQVGVDEVGSSFTIIRTFSEDDGGSVWKSERGVWFREGDPGIEWAWDAKRETWTMETVGGIWIWDKEAQESIWLEGVGGEWIFKGEVGEVLLGGLPAITPLVVAIAAEGDPNRLGDGENIIGSPALLSLPESDQRTTLTLSLPQMAAVRGQAVAADGFTPLTEGSLSWEGTIPTPFGFGGGWIDIDNQGRFNSTLPEGPIRLLVRGRSGFDERLGIYSITVQGGEMQFVTLAADKVATDDVYPQLPDPSSGSPSASLSGHQRGYYSLSESTEELMVGGRKIGEDGTLWVEGEAVLSTPVSIGSLSISRRFIAVPRTNLGVLSIDRITNPYSIPITITVDIEGGGQGFGGNVTDRYSQQGGVILHIDDSESGEPPSLIIFGSSIEVRSHRVVIPPLSCRSVIHLWESLLSDGMGDKIIRGENFSKGVNLLSHFAVLDLKPILLEEEQCPLAQ